MEEFSAKDLSICAKIVTFLYKSRSHTIYALPVASWLLISA